MKLVRSVAWSLAVLVVAACGAGASSGAPAAPTSSGVPSSATPRPSVDAPSATPDPAALPVETTAASGLAKRCATIASVMYHDAPALEALLPARVAGRDLATWSVGGRCWFEIAFDDDAVIEEILVDMGGPTAIDLSQLAQAIAGRANTLADPPFFVFAANRPEDEPEITLAMFLLLGGAGFHDLDEGADLHNYEVATIAGKEVHVGTTEMIDQTDHQRGKPYLYQTDETMFVVLTDDEGWAEEAIGQLP